MRRLLFIVVLAIIAMDATGLDALVFEEPCAPIESTQSSDGLCPAMCVRCNCCAQPVVPEFALAIASEPLPSGFVDTYASSIPRTTPSQIFHVPKFASL